VNADPVLIAGAGPTGLALALQLSRRGVPVRIIDGAQGPGERSRAMVVQARTLEFYRQLCFADKLIDDGIVVHDLHLRTSGRGSAAREVVHLDLSDMGDGISPYPFALAYPQDDHERFLTDRLAESGVGVEWQSKLEGFTQTGDGVTATVAGPAGSTAVQASYLCGCDGAHSVVRQGLGLGFAGMTYEQLFFVCDCMVATPFTTDLFITLGERALVLLFPVRSSGMQRLIGLIPPDVSDPDHATFDTIRSEVEALLGTRVTEVNWFSTYRVHHRVAQRFRVGRAFILGDAGHIHSPVGGQGMNTGIGDATNLGWKLADALRGRADAAILDSFELERITFARQLVATTDRLFTAIVRGGIAGRVNREFLMLSAIRLATRLRMVRHAFFRLVSQTAIHYHGSMLSEGRAGLIHGGDRLPWVASCDNFAPLQSLEWQVHVFGTPGPGIEDLCERRNIALQRFDWTADAGVAGFARDAAYLVRPDGYIAVAAAAAQTASLEAYLTRFRVVL
jgi:2-polyprenyl-6-methoxyphenol hydroxylase-like FAD-dependent oxidoreductase